jgi:hypothetical protein
MDIAQWYAVALGGVVALSMVAKTFLKILIYKHLRKRIGFDVLLIVAFLVGNVLCTTIRVKDIHGLTGRSGLMAIINLMPIPLGGHMNIIANRCGIRLGAYARTHRWLGRVAIVEGLIHTAAAVSLQKPNIRMLSDIAGLTVCYVPTPGSLHELTEPIRLLSPWASCCFLRSPVYANAPTKSSTSST